MDVATLSVAYGSQDRSPGHRHRPVRLPSAPSVKTPSMRWASRSVMRRPPAGGAEAAAFAGEGDEALGPAVRAAEASEAVGEDAAGEEAAQLALDEAGDAAIVGALRDVGEEGLEVLADEVVQRAVLRLAPGVGAAGEMGGELQRTVQEREACRGSRLVVPGGRGNAW